MGYFKDKKELRKLSIDTARKINNIVSNIDSIVNSFNNIQDQITNTNNELNSLFDAINNIGNIDIAEKL